MKYKINIDNLFYEEEFEKNKNNTAEILVRDKHGNDITKNCKVFFNLSKNGMLGFGTSLICCNKLKKYGIHHFYPIDQDGNIVQTLGLLLVPYSAEPIIDFWNVPSLDLNIIRSKQEEFKIPVNKIYEIELDKMTTDDFETENNNIGKFLAYNKCDQDISYQCQYIEFGLSPDAMLGFGTKLIRLAHSFKEGREVHILPASKEKGAQQSMGIYLTPDSCELIIKCKSFKSIDKILEEYRKRT